MTFAGRDFPARLSLLWNVVYNICYDYLTSAGGFPGDAGKLIMNVPS